MYVAQLLPDEVQAKVLIKALKEFTNTPTPFVESITESEREIAEEIELDLRIKMRKHLQK